MKYKREKKISEIKQIKILFRQWHVKGNKFQKTLLCLYGFCGLRSSLHFSLLNIGEFLNMKSKMSHDAAKMNFPPSMLLCSFLFTRGSFDVFSLSCVPLFYFDSWSKHLIRRIQGNNLISSKQTFFLLAVFQPLVLSLSLSFSSSFIVVKKDFNKAIVMNRKNSMWVLYKIFWFFPLEI